MTPDRPGVSPRPRYHVTVSIIDQHGGGSNVGPGEPADGPSTLHKRSADHVDRPEPADQLEWDDQSEFVRARPAGFRIIRVLVAMALLGGMGYVAFTTGRDWFAGQLDPEGEPGGEVTVDVPAGATTGDIGSILAAKEVIPNSTFFRYYAQWQDQGNFQAGEYIFRENMSADEAIAVLQSGPKEVLYGEFLVPEGLWVSEMLPRIANQINGVSEAELEAALSSGRLQPRYRPQGVDSWEGLLFPSKYFIEDDIIALEVLAKMNDEFARVTGELGYGAAEQVHDMSAYEVIIIASMVEAEAKTDGDRAKIARVIHNRLREPMRLQIDAALLYGLGDRQAQLTTDVLETDFEYNVYTRDGLPPTPIAAPGRASLEAAMNPAEGDWLFYVLADDQGNHFFTNSYDEFLEQKAISEEAGLLGG